MQTYIAGLPHRNPDLSKIKVGDTVQIIPEPTNELDPNAERVMFQGVHLGYIPRDLTPIVKTEKIYRMRVVEIDPLRKWNEVIIESV